ncbi:MAG: ribulose-bisphosphate carboxylase large subunit family protein [Candidatus Cyclobacteriaceae bacterium M3_2C_046]
MNERKIKAQYLIETAFPLEKAAEVMAGEQSSGTFVKTPGETEELRQQHAAWVDEIQLLGTVEKPSLSGAATPKGESPVYKRALVKISWPIENIGLNLAQLMATVAGNLYELGQFSGLKLLDLTIPEVFKQKYKGPGFGIDGTRKLTGVYQRPVIGTIIKPSVGLSPEATAEQVRVLIEAGLDFIKDDELMGDPPHALFEKRVDKIMAVINRFSDKSGKKPMFAFNISGDWEDMLRRHDYVVQKGGTCIMLNLNWVGIPAAERISRYTQVPIHGHRNFWGALSRSEVLGYEFNVFQKIFSLAGIDHIHTNGIRNKFCESDESVIKSIKTCLNPVGGGYPVVPVISSGQWADQAFDTYKAIQSNDLMYLCGGGITAHPGGMAAGVKSIQIAWDEAIKGNNLYQIADQYPEIQQAINFYKK